MDVHFCHTMIMEKAAEAGKSGMQFFHASQIADDDEEEDDL